MALSFTEKKRIRKSFGRIPEAIEMPNLIEVQRESYEHFLQMHTPTQERTDDGLGGVFKSVFPITDFSERATLEYVSYEFEQPKFDVEECMQRDLTYPGPPEGPSAARGLRCRRRHRRALGQGSQGAGMLSRRHPADDGEGHVHRQRHRACDRLPDAPVSGRVLRPRQGQDPLPPASCCLRPASFPTAARGSTSSSTRKTS
jgi:hypothetical protein